MASGNDWTVRIRDKDLVELGECDDYESLKVVQRFNDVGTWEMVLDRDSPSAVALTTPGNGIKVLNFGLADPVLLGGPTKYRKHQISADGRKITLSGFDDMIWTRRRNAHPQPLSSAPPYTTNGFDNKTGVCSTVLAYYVDRNLGPSAIPARQVSAWGASGDPGVGATVSGSARWQNLLTMLQELAVAGGDDVGFRITYPRGESIQFTPYQTVDRTDTIKFSEALGNLSEYEYESTAPEGNYYFVGGTGTATARTIAEVRDNTSIATWGRIEGDFLDNSTSSDSTQMAQAGNKALVDHQEKATLSIVPIDTEAMMFGRDYFLGDRVTLQVEGPAATPGVESGLIQEVIREVTLNLTPDGLMAVAPSVGTPGRAEIFRLFRAFRELRNRVINLERQ